MENKRDNNNDNNSNNNNITPEITFEKILNEKNANILNDNNNDNNSDRINKSPFLYLLQIATSTKKKNVKVNNDKISNLSLYSSEIKKEEFTPQDIELFIKEIIEKNDNTFLSGDTNLFEFLLSKYLNINKEQVKNVENFEFKIDLKLDEYNFLNEFGLKMPNLINLNLSNSFLKNISNIGISFKNLKYLDVTNCQLEEIEGIICFPSLQNLLASKNQISDIFDLTDLSNLRHLELESNKINDLESLEFLNMLENIEYISLGNNPLIENENFSKEKINEIFDLKKLEGTKLDLNLLNVDKLENIPKEKLIKLEGKFIEFYLKGKITKVKLFSSESEMQMNNSLINNLINSYAENLIRNGNSEIECIKYQKI